MNHFRLSHLIKSRHRCIPQNYISQESLTSVVIKAVAYVHLAFQVISFLYQ